MEPTTQELFDRVRDHLLTQNARSAIGASCQYRGPAGLKCAIGALIDDDHYDYCMENYSVNRPDVYRAVESSIGRALTDEDSELLDALQCLHDLNEVSDWPSALDATASARGLRP